MLRTYPHLRDYLKRCRHCGIFFFTHPANAKRTDLRCPFGCSASHRRQRATERSVAYYRTEAGKQKKRRLNRNRYLGLANAGSQVHVQDHTVERTEDPCDEPIVGYVRMVMSLIEGRRVSRDEVFGMLEQIWRQHSLSHSSKTDYASGQLNKSPP